MKPTGFPRAFSAGNSLPVLARLLISGAAYLLYVGAFYSLHNSLGLGVLILMIFPVSVSGWLFGGLAGTLCGLAGVGFNLFLLSSLGRLDWQNIFLSSVPSGALIIILTGFLLGQVSQLSRRVNRELEERAKTEQRQKGVAGLLKSTLEASANGLLFLDAAGKVAAHNQMFTYLWGLSAEALQGASSQRLLESLAEKTRNHKDLLTHMHQALARPEREHLFELFLLNGRVLKCHAAPRGPDGGSRAGGLVLSCEDITEFKQKNDALLESEKKLRGLIHNSANGVSLVDEQGRVIEWNPAQEAITGLGKNDALGRPIWDVMHALLSPELKMTTSLQELRSRLSQAVQKLRSTGESHHLIEQNINRNGEVVAVEITLFLIPGEKGVMLGLVYRDVTRLKLAEEALLQRYEMTQTILNACPDMAALLDMSGRVLAINAPFAQSIGKEAPELVGKNLYALLSDGTAQVRKQGVLEVVLSGQPTTREVLLGERCYTDTFFPITNVNSPIARVALFSHDVTESRQRERELEAVASISSALRAALTRAEVYPIIFEQVETLLKADGIGLILRDAETGEVRVEQACGAWTSLMHMSFSAEQATRGPVLILDEPYLNNAIENSSHLFQTKPFTGLKATACVPLQIEGNIIGSLWIGRRAQITPNDVRILTALAHITANAIHRVALYEQTRLYADQLASAGEIGRELAETLSLTGIYSRLAQSIHRMLPNIARVLITRFDAEAQQITSAYSLQDGKPVDVAEAPPIALQPPEAGGQNWVIYSRQPLVQNDHSGRKKASSAPLPRSALFVPLVVKGEALGVLQLESYASRRFGSSDVELLTLIGNTAAIAIQNAHLYENLQQSHQSLTQAYEATLEGWAHALDLRDHGTHDHTDRVVKLTVELGRRLGIEEQALTNLRRGAQLHDIGKMGIPDSILLKPGPLTEEEWKIMRMHPVYAYEMLYPVPEFRKILDIPYCHHEKWDGTGYPRELHTEEIPLPARIFAVVDVWDALCSDRPYRRAWPEEKVVDYLKLQAGSHFDPQVVGEFLGMINANGPGALLGA